ncbi:hypothetical protein B0J17DRAFT_582524 [Rhizoctonia solani]|nr:hypothetical protein B0J17DRAFT_582524 [Rhizoctonia solani]
MPHKLRAVAGSQPVYLIPLIIFMDDVSGNVSKQWNKHFSCSLSNATLPCKELHTKSNVRFVSTSPHATPLELMHGICSSIYDAFHNPTIAFDCLTQEEVLIWLFPLFWAGDNPMQAEHCSSSRLASNKFCQTCKVGGDNKFKYTMKTQQLIEERLDMVLKLRRIQKVKDHTSDLGIKDPIAQPLTSQNRCLYVLEIYAASVNICNTCQYILYLSDHTQISLGMDIHLDTPTKILHTILLGVVKYFWAQSVFVLEKDKKLSILVS